jgi:RNA polymerase sigma-70 factor, ECF subfamily
MTRSSLSVRRDEVDAAPLTREHDADSWREQAARTNATDAPPVDHRRGVPIAPQNSLRRLFDDHYDSIWRLLRRLGVHPAQLDDAAQEVFWIAARRLADIRAGSEHAFLYGVALRVASHENRRRRDPPTLADDPALALPDLVPSPEEQFQRRQARALLDAVLDRMPRELRTVFVLCELEELEVRQAAEAEGIPIGTASSRLRRAREEFSVIFGRTRRKRPPGPLAPRSPSR